MDRELRQATVAKGRRPQLTEPARRLHDVCLRACIVRWHEDVQPHLGAGNDHDRTSAAVAARHAPPLPGAALGIGVARALRRPEDDRPVLRVHEQRTTPARRGRSLRHEGGDLAGALLDWETGYRPTARSRIGDT